MKSAVSPPTTRRKSQKTVEATRHARAFSLLEQLAEDGHERRRERRVGDERADEVRDLEGDREGVDRPAGAEVVRGDDLADEAEHAGKPRRAEKIAVDHASPAAGLASPRTRV